MSFRWPSLHSPTTALTVPVVVPISGLCFKLYSMSPSMAAGTLSVLVTAIGVSSTPSSSICVTPAALPKPLITYTAASTFRRKMLSACGRMTVTPVRTSSPCTTSTCPTRTSGTSVMALRSPVGSVPKTSPSSRGRGLG